MTIGDLIVRTMHKRHFKYLLSIITVSILTLHPSFSQIKGKVTDAETGETLPLVNVYYGKQKIVNISNVNGRFSMPSPTLKDTIYFSFVGYETHKECVLPGENKTLNIKMRGIEQKLDEVVIRNRKHRYSRKNNPAVELMKKVIEEKGEHSLMQNEFYRYNKYQKITFGFNNITQEFIDSGFIRKYPELMSQVEFCPQTQTMILPLTYNETASEHIYRKEPRDERNFILGTHSEGLNELFVTGDIANIVLQQYFSDVNIYDNNIHLFERQFVSPFSSHRAISFYQYFIMDTIKVDDTECIELSFVPQNPQDFGFSGRIWILNDSTYRIKKCTIHLPVRSSVNFINNLILEQDFATLANGQRVLVRDQMIAELGIVKKFHNMILKRTTTYSDFDFSPISETEFIKDDNRREGSYKNKNEDFWKEYRTDTLTHSESNISNMVNQLKSKRGFGFVMWVVRAFVENYVETSPVNKKNYVDFGPVNTLVSSNFIDKFRLRASVQTNANLHPRLFFKGYVAYGFKDQRWKYDGTLEYSFYNKQYSPEEFPKNSITLSTRYDVMAPSDVSLPTDKDNVFTSLKTQIVDQMIYFRNYNLRYIYEFDNHFSISTQLRHLTQYPTGSLFYETLSGTQVHKITQSEATVCLRFAPGEETIVTKQRRTPISHNYTIFSFMHTSGFKNVLGSDYNANYSEFSFSKRFWLNSFGRLDLYASAGAQWNRVPFPLLITPASNNSYIIHRNMFNMINNMEFVNDRFVSLDVQWDLSGKLLNRIPLLKHLKWREVIGFKSLYGSLTDKNNPLLHPNSEILLKFPSRNGQTTSFVMGKAPYMEVNVGIHNILKFIRIDYVRRINYLHLPGAKKNGVRFTFQADF